MATQYQPPVPGASNRVRRKFFPRWRVFTWVILAFNLIMLTWVILGASSGPDCGGKTGDALTQCEAGQVGTGIGVFGLILIWALGDIILGVLWMITKPHKRECPACGNSVRKGVMRCGACGYDFRQMLRPGAPPGEATPTAGAPPGGAQRGWPEHPAKGKHGKHRSHSS
ncbi:MAG: hypothetical protein ACRDOV_16380 [Streptomyces sp.]